MYDPAPKKAAQTRSVILHALRDAAPVSISIAAYGLVFGSLAHQAGWTWVTVLVMSVLVFSGSVQFAALPLVQAGVGVWQLFVTALVLSLRHLVMGLSLTPLVQGMGVGYRLLLAYGVNDESYALTTRWTARQGYDSGYMFGAGLATFSAWTVSTVTGAVLGRVLGAPERWGLDFAFPAVFIAMLAPQVVRPAGIVAAATSALGALASASVLPGGSHVLVSAVIAAIVGVVMDRDP